MSPWALNATDLDRLRQRVAEAEGELQTPKHQALPWPERTRNEQEAKSLRRELQVAEFEAKLEARRQAQRRQLAPGGPVAANAASAPQFMEPVPYYATSARRVFVVNVASGVMGGPAGA